MKHLECTVTSFDHWLVSHMCETEDVEKEVLHFINMSSTFFSFFLAHFIPFEVTGRVLEPICLWVKAGYTPDWVGSSSWALWEHLVVLEFCPHLETRTLRFSAQSLIDWATTEPSVYNAALTLMYTIYINSIYLYSQWKEINPKK